MATISEKLAGFAHDLTYNDIPQHVIEKIKLHMLDFLGICFVSSKMEFAEVVYKTAASMGKGEEATVVGIGKRLPMVGAAMVNGALAHGIDFDDTHIKAIVHVSAPLVAGGLAVGEAKNVSGRKLLESLAAGMETAIRLGMVAEGRFNDRGLHQTANLSPFGICLTACKLLDVPQENSINGLGVCGTMASGITQIENSWLKRINPGWAAHSGILSALLGMNGYIGPRQVFEGVHGIFPANLGPKEFFHWELITDGLGSKWETGNIAVKPYPSCHYTHAFIDSAKYLREQYTIDPQQIDKIICKTTERIVPVVFEPKNKKVRPTIPYEAQFSTQYLVAAMLCKGYVNLETMYFDPLNDPEILALAEKVEWVPDPQSDFPANFPGEVHVIYKDGREFVKREALNRGGPGNPMSRDEIIEKFMGNACRVIPSGHAEEIIDLVSGMEEVSDIGQLAKLYA